MNNKNKTDFRHLVDKDSKSSRPITVAQLEFLNDLVPVNENTRILDIGPYKGAHLLALQKISRYAFGVDKVVTRELRENPNVAKCDVFRNDIPYKNIDLAYCFSPYFDDDWEKIEVMFSNVSDSLNNDSIFVLDMLSFNSIPVGRYEFENGETTEIREKHRYLRHDRESRKYGITKQWRVFSKDELSTCLKKGRLKLLNSYADFDTQTKGVWTPSNSIKSSRLQVTAGKL